MNDLVRLPLHIEAQPILSPLRKISRSLESEQFLLSLEEAFAAVDGAGSEAERVEEDLLSPEIVESKADASQPVEPDIYIPMLPAALSGEPEVLAEPDIANIAPRPLVTVADEPAPVEGDLPLDKPVTDNDSARPLQSETLQPAPTIFDQRELSAQATNADPDQKKPAPVTGNITAKEVQPSSGSSLAKPTGLEQQSQSGPALDSSSSPVQSAAPSHPVPLAVPSAPASPSPLTAMAVNGSVPSPAAIPVPVLDMETGHQWIARLSQDINQLSAEKPVLDFRLKPENLGKLNVRITAGAAGDVVRLEAENETVKSLLVASQGRLEQDIRLAGLRLARVDVTVQDHAASHSGQQGFGSREGGTENGRNSDAPPQGYRAPRSPVTQNGSDAALTHDSAARLPHHGARYA